MSAGHIWEIREAVSYTHLDVYKRQEGYLPGLCFIAREKDKIIGYNALDVYKRQALFSAEGGGFGYV